MNMENFTPGSSEGTGKFKAVPPGIDLDAIMKEVDEDFNSGKLVREPHEFIDPADMDDATTKRLDARGHNKQ